MAAQYTFTTFTPAEAERITGVSTALQRDWRRRGYLPTLEKHARFDMFDLAGLMARGLLASRGIGPQLTEEVIPWCVSGIAWHALKWVDAYEGDHHRTLDWRPPQFRPSREISPEMEELLRRAAADDGKLAEWSKSYDPAWSERGNWLARQILSLKGFPRVIPARYFIWWANDQHVWHESLDKAFDGWSDDPRVAGPVLVLDLQALASQLQQRAGRALVHVEFPQNPETGELVDPMHYGVPIPLSQRGEDSAEETDRS